MARSKSKRGLILAAAMFAVASASFAAAAETGQAATDAPTATLRIFIAGDSTASLYEPSRYPRMGWGQVLDRFFDARVAVIDRAQSGRSSRSFIEQGWLAPIARDLRAGDLFLIQFGHNDEKIEDPSRYTQATTQFPRMLERYVDAARQAGAQPVLISPVARRQFDGDKVVDGHGDYARAVLDLATRLKVPSIDLNALSMALVQRAGPVGSTRIYLYVPAQALADDTHFQEHGAEAIACLVVSELKRLALVPAQRIVRNDACVPP
jgi:lysophospholipase L1-like esterase